MEETYREQQEEIHRKNEVEGAHYVKEQPIENLEKISALELRVDKLLHEKIHLEQKLSQYSDYDVFKKKFEQFSIAKESAEAEKEILQKKVNQQDEQIQALREQVEIYQLEIDLAARGDDIPSDPEELKKNYGILKSAFEQADMELELQKDIYEEKLEKLNEEIASLKRKQQHLLDTDEVKKFVEKKDQELKEVYALLD